MRTLVGMMGSILLFSSFSISPASDPKDCSLAAEEGGACPLHEVGSGSSALYVDCGNGLAFGSHFSGSKGSFIFIPQLDDGDDSAGDIVKKRQEDALTTVVIFDPEEFPADPAECRREVFFAIGGVFQPFSCVSSADCLEGGFCLAPFGCAFFCADSSTCPSNYICSRFVNRCVLPKIAIGPADVVETRRATPPTVRVIQVTAHGILDLLDESEEPTGRKVMFRANGQMVWEESLIPVENEVRIELQEYSGP